MYGVKSKCNNRDVVGRGVNGKSVKELGVKFEGLKVQYEM